MDKIHMLALPLQVRKSSAIEVSGKKSSDIINSEFLTNPLAKKARLRAAQFACVDATKVVFHLFII